MRFTNAHRVEVEVSADGLASAPPSGPPPLRRQRAPSLRGFIHYLARHSCVDNIGLAISSLVDDGGCGGFVLADVVFSEWEFEFKDTCMCCGSPFEGDRWGVAYNGLSGWDVKVNS
jgi:hypothetical protein